ncbi:MAG: tetratricopeptide repeat protein [Candidatus Eremiobacteraeota bacterium]|nr:tetratricopeptide repeat protein [Candidatus Eremiobacteraeota bacterium]
MLEDFELRLILNPDDPDLLFRRAFALESLGRTDDAKGAYLALLRHDPSHPGALNNLARLLHHEGALRPARLLLERLVDADAQSVSGHANLGIILLELDEFDGARRHLRRALELDDAYALAHLGLARIFAIEGDDARALEHQRLALGDAAVTASAAHGSWSQRAPQLLLLASEEQLGAVTAEWLADATFSIATLVVERACDAALPRHHAIFNTISDADRNADALVAARTIVGRSPAPVINHPDAVLATARTALEARLHGIPDVIVPRVLAFARDAPVPDVGWPMLVRAPGFHSGQHFVKVDTQEALPAAVTSLPGNTLLAIELLPSRGVDGRYRKYRTIIVDGELYPIHAAVSDHWKVHYFSAEMQTHAERRTEDHAFLEDMAEALGSRATIALGAIARALQLDYGGIDFGLDAQGRVLVFEANATMTVPAPPRGAEWDYRRAPVKKILDATRRMLLKRSRAGGWL